tara:strand:- start:49016 stop:49348 length:333 start_codon:yes stop_codon:yes gene_type:complete
MNAFQIMGDPVKRKILELLANSELSAGEVVADIRNEFGITQAAVSQHLKILRESGLAHVRGEGAKRIYILDATPMREVDNWISPFRVCFEQRLRALHTEIARGKKENNKE